MSHYIAPFHYIQVFCFNADANIVDGLVDRWSRLISFDLEVKQGLMTVLQFLIN